MILISPPQNSFNRSASLLWYVGETDPLNFWATSDLNLLALFLQSLTCLAQTLALTGRAIPPLNTIEGKAG